MNINILLFLNLIPYLYVPGKLSNVNKVIVDVGTGYFIEKVKTTETKTSIGGMCADMT